MGGVSAGTVVGGKYRLEQPIGRGGMASVWRATHTTLENSVAVKFLEMFGSARDNMAARFLREAKLAAGLRHRNVVQLLDYGVADDGQPFMVMELLEGSSLADRLDNGPPMSEVELFETVAMVLSGLASVHEAGIVHRDMKPDNIFLVRDSDGDYPKLLDFGISRGVALEGADTRVTNTGAVVGTPLYMSPEQARGVKDLDHRTDLFSVGMMLYEALTGVIPFEAENMGDVLIRVATEDMPSIAIARPDLPPEAVTAIDRALMRDRSKRFGDAREMRKAVLAASDAMAGAPPTRRRDPSTQRVPQVRSTGPASTNEIAIETRRKRPWALVIAGVGALALAGALALFIGLGGKIQFAGDDATTERAASPPAEPTARPAEPTAPSPPTQESQTAAEVVPRAPDPPAVVQVAADPPPTPEEPRPRIREGREEAPPPPDLNPPIVRTERATPPREEVREQPPARAEPPRRDNPRRDNPRQREEQREGGFLRDLDY
jgi:hypothetical protein